MSTLIYMRLDVIEGIVTVGKMFAVSVEELITDFDDCFHLHVLFYIVGVSCPI